MNKIDLGQSIVVLANLGVIAGIVFLGFELRQTRIALQDSSHLATAYIPTCAGYWMKNSGSGGT